jgi:hypothetical protein
MQDRICQIDENLLQRTAGPYIRVMNRPLSHVRQESGSPLTPDVSLRCSEHGGIQLTI